MHVVVLQRKAKKCTKVYNTHAEPMFWFRIWLLKLFSDVLVAVVVSAGPSTTTAAPTKTSLQNITLLILFVLLRHYFNSAPEDHGFDSSRESDYFPLSRPRG